MTVNRIKNSPLPQFQSWLPFLYQDGLSRCIATSTLKFGGGIFYSAYRQHFDSLYFGRHCFIRSTVNCRQFNMWFRCASYRAYARVQWFKWFIVHIPRPSRALRCDARVTWATTGWGIVQLRRPRAHRVAGGCLAGSFGMGEWWFWWCW